MIVYMYTCVHDCTHMCVHERVSSSSFSHIAEEELKGEEYTVVFVGSKNSVSISFLLNGQFYVYMEATLV